MFELDNWSKLLNEMLILKMKHYGNIRSFIIVEEKIFFKHILVLKKKNHVIQFNE